MKPKLQDYLLIGGALIAIFVSGYGIGFLFGERSATNRLTPLIEAAGQRNSTPWEQRTVDRLTKRLGLNAEQIEKISKEIDATSGEIRNLRQDAIKGSQRVLLDLHERIEVHLDEKQRNLLENDKEALERALN